MNEHKHGSMDIKQHERDFVGFLKISTWIVVVAILVLIFLAIFNS